MTPEDEHELAMRFNRASGGILFREYPTEPITFGFKIRCELRLIRSSLVQISKLCGEQLTEFKKSILRFLVRQD